MKAKKLLSRYRVDNPCKFKLAKCNPSDTCGLDIDKDDAAKAFLARGIERVSDFQERLYAQDRWAVLAIFQAMDTAGKDGAIKHVMSGSIRRAARCIPFQQPKPRRRIHHDFLWRCSVRLPERGASASSIVPTTKKCLLCVCTKMDWRARSCQNSCWARRCGTIGSRTFAPTSAISAATGSWSEVLPSPVEGRAAASLSRTPG